MRVVHLSDLHFWRLAADLRRPINKRLVGLMALAAGRARRFRLERWGEVRARVESLRPDHVLITGDLTTTALEGEFADARAALAPLLADPGRATVIPGNHDRYTGESVRAKRSETYFGPWMGAARFPWLRWIDEETAILGLDPTRSHLSATGLLPTGQLEAARALLAEGAQRPARLIVACHYPLEAPDEYARELARKRLVNAEQVARWLATLGPHVYCCGHVHAAWAIESRIVPGQIALNAGAPLMRTPPGRTPPGFLEIELDGADVRAVHHAWGETGWTARPLLNRAGYFRRG